MNQKNLLFIIRSILFDYSFVWISVFCFGKKMQIFVLIAFVLLKEVLSDTHEDIYKILSESEMTIDEDLVRRSTTTRNTRAVDPYLLTMTPHNQDDDEMRLVSHLLNNYNKEVRPVQNKSDAVQVIFGMAYTQLLDLEEKNQVLVSNVWIRMRWFNHLLKWDPSDYGGIKSINLPPQLIWVPDIVLYNNAEETLGAGQMDQFKTKIILQHDGLNKWFAPTILRSRCSINVEFFPFDDQKCDLKFLSWTYDGLRINITNSSPTADLATYLPSGEFELISAEAVRKITKYPCCDEPYPHVTFTIHIRRKTLFYFNNLIVPCFLITALGLLTFVLPPATGERVTLVITTLLAMTVFMLMIAEKTPTTSKVTPLIGKFFIASMVIIGLSLIATCIVLNLYECTRAVESVPKPIRIIVLEYLAPFLRVDPPIQRKLARPRSNQQVDTAVHEKHGTTEVTTGNGAWRFHDNFHPAHHHHHHHREETSRQRNVAVLPKEISEGIAVLSERAKQQEKFDELTEEWQAVAKVADRLFLIIFLLTIAITTVYIFVNRPDPDSI
eukprot:TCONS_00068759-protein